MAVRTSNFEIAALDAVATQAPDENVAELNHGNGYFSLWRRPRPGQFAILQLRMSRGNGTDRMQGLDRFFSKIILTPEEVLAEGRTDADGRTYLERAEAGDKPVGVEFFWDLIDRDVMEVDTLVEMMREAVEIHSGFPTSSSPASSPSATSSGPRSTATSRRAKSTPST